MKGYDCVVDLLELGGLSFHGDRETQYTWGVPAGGVDMVPAAEDMKTDSLN